MIDLEPDFDALRGTIFGWACKRIAGLVIVGVVIAVVVGVLA